jgi:transposase
VFFFAEAIMQNVTLVGIDLGKHAFHLHGQDRQGKAVFRKKVSRKQLVEFFATPAPWSWRLVPAPTTWPAS